MTTTIRTWTHLPVEIKSAIISKCTFEAALNLSRVDKEALLLCLTEPTSPLVQDRLHSRMLPRVDCKALLSYPHIFKAGTLRAYFSFLPPYNWQYLRAFCERLEAALGSSIARVTLSLRIPNRDGSDGDILWNLGTLPTGMCGRLHVRHMGTHDLVIPNKVFIKEIYLHDRDFDNEKTTILSTFLRVLALQKCRSLRAVRTIDLTGLQSVEELVISDPIMGHGRVVPWSIEFPQHVETLRVEHSLGPPDPGEPGPKGFALNHLSANITHIVLKRCSLFMAKSREWPKTLQSLEFIDAKISGRRLSDTLFPRTFRKLTIRNTIPIFSPSLDWLLKVPQTLPQQTEIAIQVNISDIPDLEPEYSDFKQRIDLLEPISVEARYLQQLCESMLGSHHIWLGSLSKMNEDNESVQFIESDGEDNDDSNEDQNDGAGLNGNQARLDAIAAEFFGMNESD